MISTDFLRNLDDESGEFFSEKNIDQWMKMVNKQLTSLKKNLLRMLLLVMIPGCVFSVFIALLLSGSNVLFWVFFPVFTILFLAFFLSMTMSSLMYFIKMHDRQKRGIYFAEIECGCPRNTFMMIPEDNENYFIGKEGKFLSYNENKIERCRACDENISIKSVLKKNN